jgi:hypothetical protein
MPDEAGAAKMSAEEHAPPSWWPDPSPISFWRS